MQRRALLVFPAFLVVVVSHFVFENAGQQHNPTGRGLKGEDILNVWVVCGKGKSCIQIVCGD